MNRRSEAATPAFLALACVGLFSGTPGMAQDDAASEDDEERIVVEGKRPEGEVQSIKATAPVLDTPQTVTVVSEQVIRK